MDSTGNNLQRFTGRAEDYRIGRPAYAEAFIESLYLERGFSETSVIADIGSGTGKFARQLLDRGSFVYCVEPNDDMRSAAAEELGRYKKFHAVAGSAAATGLDAQSVDFVTTAQAFHWFDVALFQKECRRILKENGMVFLIWNMRDENSEVNRRSFEIFSRFCPAFKGFSGGIQKNDSRIGQFFDSKYECVTFDNPIIFDREKFISRCLSGSYSLKEGDRDFQEYLGELSALFERYAQNGLLTMANSTVAYFGTL